MPYPKVSADQIDLQIHAFEQSPASQSVEQRQEQAAGVSPANRGAPAKPVDVPIQPPAQAASNPASAAAFPNAPKPDLQGMAADTAAAQKKLNEVAPGPQIPWMSALQVAGPVAAALGAAHYLFGGEKEPSTGKPSDRVSVKDMPQEPTMNKVHNSLQDLMASKEEGLLASQRAEQAAAQLAQETPQAVSAQAKPLVDVAIDEEIGKPMPKQDMTLVEQGTANKALNEANADVKAGEKKIAGAAAPKSTPKVVDTEKGVAPSLTKEQKGMKSYLVSYYGGGAEGEAAYKKVSDILGETPAYEKGKGGGLSKEANQVIKDWRKANIEGPKVNLTHDMKKTMKGAGGLALLAAIPGFAEAAQKKDIGKMSDIASDFFVLPFAQSRGLNESEDQELAKRRYEGAVGGGRGIAPPSAYQR